MGTNNSRIFLDSSLILSGLISRQGAPRLILDLLSLRLPMIQGVTGLFNLTEIERNIVKKAPAALNILNAYIPQLDLDIVPVPFLDELEPFRGAVGDEDLPALASAATSHADFFVTGDQKLLARIARQSVFLIRSLGPEEFLNGFLPKKMADQGRSGEPSRGAKATGAI